MDQEMTLQDVVRDPLIAMLMRADGVAPDALNSLLQRTAEIEVERLQQQIRQARAQEFYRKLEASNLSEIVIRRASIRPK